MYLFQMTEFVVVWFSFVYALLDSVSHGSLEQKLKKKMFVKMDTECWKLLVK